MFLRVQAEIARRSNILTEGKKRIYSSKYALSNMVFCGHCGDKKICEEQNISISELPRRICQSRQNLSKKLKRSTLTVEELTEIADALGVTFEQSFTLPDGTQFNNDLYFLCYMTERVARKLHQRNAYVVNSIPKEEWVRLISLASVIHCENPAKTETEWTEQYHLERGSFDITAVDGSLADRIPSETQMGKVYMRLILATLQPGEDYIDGFIRVYNDEICKVIDNYNGSAYYEPSYVITRAYNSGGF